MGTFILPSNQQMLKGDNIGKINNLENRVAKLETTPSGGSPSGSTPDVQYNNGGVFGAITSNTTATQKFLSQVSTGVPTWETIDLSGYLTLDQTTPQHIINGAPIFDSGLEVGTTGSLGPSGTANAVINSDGSASFGGGSASINYDGTFVVNSLGLDDTFFAGSGAGSGATNASSSNFFGSYAGFGAYDASSSNFFGTAAGSGATEASFSNFFGNYAGYGAYNASSSNFFGNYAGSGAYNASFSNFFGNYAGSGAYNASYSNFFGYSAGSGAYNASYSIFLGTNAGNMNNTIDSTFVNNLIIDQSILSTNSPRTSIADIQNNALMYGTFADTASGQSLTINANTKINGTLTTTNNTLDDGSGNITASGSIKGGGFKSSDGSAGITGTFTTASLVGKTVTFKNGLITGFA